MMSLYKVFWSSSMTQPSQALPANQAFVVQIRSQPTGEPLRCEGRVEHLASGQASRFSSQAELWTFITQLLTDLQSNSDAT